MSKKSVKKTVLRIDHDQLNADLSLVDFSQVYNTQNPDEAAEIMVNTIKKVIETNSKSIKVPNRKSTIKPWITPGLLRCIRHRDNLHKKNKKSPNNETLKITFTRYRNFCNKLLKKLKREHEKSELTKAGNNPRQLWSAINTLTNRVTHKETSKPLLKLANTPKLSVDGVNDFFAAVGERLAEKIVVYPAEVATDACNKVPQSMVLLPTDEVEVGNLIMNLRSGSAVGWDRISSDLLKRHRFLITPPLTYICNLALSTGKFPKVFKIAIIHPIFKSGDRTRVDNYRPIAVLPALSKVLERIMNIRLVNYLEKHNLLSSTQFGFRTGKSTSDAVHELTNFIVTNLDKGQKVLGIFLDLAKAFDTVSVPILTDKLENLGIRGIQLQLFKDYLRGRTQCVKIDDFLSDERKVTYGVPQGSVLGPTLFLIYINDLGMLTLPKGRIISFADDTALLFSADSWRNVYSYAQSGFNTVTKCLRSIVLTLNASKTHYVPFALKKSNLPTVPDTIKFHSCPAPHDAACNCFHLSKAESVKYLGVIVDNTLRFHQHIDSLITRLRKLIYIFKTLRHVADDKLKRSVYFALVQSLISYCITTWGGAPKTTLLELERAQRVILKVSNFLPYRYPTDLLYKQSKTLTVRQLFILNTLLKQHSLLTYHPFMTHGKRRYNPVNRTHSPLSTVFSNRFFCYLGRFLYNKINNTQQIFNLNKGQCKKKLATWLLGLNYDDTEKLLTSMT